jgi:hypothetical protein
MLTAQVIRWIIAFLLFKRVKMPPFQAHSNCGGQLLLFTPAVLAALVGDAAARLAGGLAGGLALAAAALGSAFTEVARFDGGDMFHRSKPPSSIFSLLYTIDFPSSQSKNPFPGVRH